MTYRDETPPSFLAIGVLSCVFFGVLGAVMAFSAYGEAIDKSNPTWIIGVGIAAFGILVLPLVARFLRDSRSVYRTGINGLAGAIGLSYVMTNSAISPFLTMPMNIGIRIFGLAFCIGGNIWWCGSFIRVYMKIYKDKSLFDKLYVDAGSFFVMMPGRDARLIEKQLRFNQMLPSYLIIPILPLAPLSLILERVLEPVMGFSGFWTLAAFIFIPLSILFNGFLVKGVFMYFYFPAKLTKVTGKPVHFARFWDTK